MSGIKSLLLTDKYKWNDDLLIVSSLTKACRRINDKVSTRLPIHCSLLELMLFELQRKFSEENQWYLECLYKAIFILGYYGLLRISELVFSEHVLKAANVHMGLNKDKLLLVLYSLKTHGKGQRPQRIKIVSNRTEKSGHYLHSNFCPFKVINCYIQVRGNYECMSEPFFIFRDRSLVKAFQARNMLKLLITRLGLDCKNYGMQSLRIGRTSDLVKYNYSIEEVQRMGRWHSNAVYKYIRNQ